MARGTVVLKHAGESRNKHQSVTLLEAIEEFGFDACIGGARRDEEKARAKERIMSFRDEFGQWDPKNQRPELWNLYNARRHPGENIRAFPISNLTELDVWQYIAREQLELPSIYFAHTRPVVRKNGLLQPVTALTPAKDGDVVEEVQVRFRTVGDISCTAPVESDADTVEKILAETATTTITERGATEWTTRPRKPRWSSARRKGTSESCFFGCLCSTVRWWDACRVFLPRLRNSPLQQHPARILEAWERTNAKTKHVAFEDLPALEQPHASRGCAGYS